MPGARQARRSTRFHLLSPFHDAPHFIFFASEPTLRAFHFLLFLCFLRRRHSCFLRSFHCIFAIFFTYFTFFRLPLSPISRIISVVIFIFLRIVFISAIFRDIRLLSLLLHCRIFFAYESCMRHFAIFLHFIFFLLFSFLSFSFTERMRHADIFLRFRRDTITDSFHFIYLYLIFSSTPLPNISLESLSLQRQSFCFI